MKSKYYTPTIEEFHVGFEYEVLALPDADEYNRTLTTFPIQEKNEWFKFKFPDPYVGYMLPRLFKHCTIRVKYLDKEDIEDFDFKWSSSDSKDSIYATKDIILNSHKFYYRIIHEEKTMICEIQYKSLIPYLKPQTLFKGTVKNKSELKRILNQVNII